MKAMSVYRFPAHYAKENGEVDQYRESYKANIACADAIAEAIRNHYANNKLDASCVQEVVEQFGSERVFFVLANTVHQKSWDGRISFSNKEWAKTIPDFEDLSFGYNRRLRYVVDGVNPGLIDLFLTAARKDYLKEKK